MLTRPAVAVLGLALALTGTGGAVAVAGSRAAFACTMRADVPNQYNNAIVGREGCAQQISVTGYIKEQRNNAPDDIVGSRTFLGGTALVNGSCGNGGGNYYSEANSSSGAQAKSSTAFRCG